MDTASIGIRQNARLAGVLFIAATTATSGSQLLMQPILADAFIVAAIQSSSTTFALAIMLELVNALASTGIAIALFVILNACSKTSAIGYLGLRTIEGALGIVAAAALLAVFTDPEATGLLVALHDTAFLMVLLVFSVSTCVLYPMLWRFHLVPTWLSVWGMIGGGLLMISVVMIIFGQHAVGSTADVILSLPIAVNEMALAVWLIVRGVDVPHPRTGG